MLSVRSGREIAAAFGSEFCGPSRVGEECGICLAVEIVSPDEFDIEAGTGFGEIRELRYGGCLGNSFTRRCRRIGCGTPRRSRPRRV